jgi:phosphatidylglycerophosphate synthase
MLKQYLSQEQLEKIKNHKYVPCALSGLDNILNKYVWIPISQVMPHRISPNMVTLSGVLALASGTALIYSYDNTLTKALPNWVYFYLVFTMFFFQTMDAVDGKHARNTGRASPLGQLVDHGLDIFSYAFQLTMVVLGHRLGSTWGCFIYQLFCYSIYYSHTWEEYYSGIFSTQVDGVGVTEFQVLAGIIILCVPMFGELAPYYPIMGMTFGAFFSLLILLLGVLHVYTTISRTIAKIPRDKLMESLTFFLPLIPIITSMFILQFLEILKKNTLEMVIVNGLVFSLLTAHQIIVTTTKSEKITYHPDSFFYMIVLFVCLFVTYKIQVVLISLYALVVLTRYFHYIINVTKQIMKFLNIGF